MIDKDPKKSDVNSFQGDPLAEIVPRLIEAYRPERIYLFGSRARDDFAADSDYDFMVVVPDSAPPRAQAKSSRLLPSMPGNFVIRRK